MITSKRPERISAVIFDLDGTLLNTLENIAQSMNTILNRHGFPTHTIDQYRNFIGQGIGHLAEKAIQKSNSTDVSIEEIIQELINEYELSLNNKTYFYEGIPELLDDLTSKKLPMAILSNNNDYLTQKLVKMFFKKKWSFGIINGVQPGFLKKPDPALALNMVEKLGTKPNECIFVGDTPADMQTAINAGMFPIGVLWGFRNEEILMEAGAEILVRHPSEISDFISEQIQKNSK